jgi:hypothetical protein
VARGSQYTTPRVPPVIGEYAPSGTPTCSLQVTWSKPRRSPASAIAAISAIPADSSQAGLTPGSWTTTGVLIPILTFMLAPPDRRRATPPGAR